MGQPQLKGAVSDLPGVSWYRSFRSPGFGVEFHPFATNLLLLSPESQDTVLRIHGDRLHLMKEHPVRGLAGEGIHNLT